MTRPGDRNHFLFHKPVRLKDRGYLAHIRRMDCLVCGSPGVDAHHLMHAEKSAMGARSGDDWAVPLCRHHHDELHRSGGEALWWTLNGIDPMDWARKSYGNWRNDHDE